MLVRESFLSLIEVVSSIKLLGLKLASDLTWNDHITEVVKEASKRFYFLIQPKRARISLHDAVPAFYNALPRAAMPREKGLVYDNFMRARSSTAVGHKSPMLDHCELLCQKLFNTMLGDPSHKLKAILPLQHDNSRYNLGNSIILMCHGSQ